MRAKNAAHRDPDVVALIAAGGGLLDPRSLVINEARKLNALYRRFDSGNSGPFDRLKQLASIRGFTVRPMLDGSADTQRDAVVLMADTATSKGGQIFYNPHRSLGRVAFSVAHEIAHSFFPSTHGGARFREMFDEAEEEASELEQLCHVGAAELLMPLEEFAEEAEPAWSLRGIQELATKFGSSIEATVFRLATAHPGIAIAGTVMFRHTKGDAARIAAAKLTGRKTLFAVADTPIPPSVQPPKYRRQSFHASDKGLRSAMVPWNKSFDPASCIYATSDNHQVAYAVEPHPMDPTKLGIMEAMRAPFQRSGASAMTPDVLFLWKQIYRH